MPYASAGVPLGAVKPEVDLFGLKPIQDSIESSYYTEFRPISSGFDEVLEFNIHPSPDFIDLSLSKLHLKVRILDPNGKLVENKINEKTDAQTKEKVYERIGVHAAPVNNFMGSLFNQVMVSFNNRNVTQPDTNFHWKTYIENLLNYGFEAKGSHLVTQMYIEDVPGRFDDFNGKGFQLRMNRIGDNGTIEMIGPLNIDLARDVKVVLNKMNIGIKLYRNKPSFSLMLSENPGQGKEYKIEITDAVLLVRKLKINEQDALAMEKKLQTRNTVYNINRCFVKTFIIPKDATTHVIDNLFSSQLPKRLFIMAIEEDREMNYLKNPYKFSMFNLSYAHLSGDALTSLRPVRMNEKNKEFMEAYSNFIDATNIYGNNYGNHISLDDFTKNNFILGKLTFLLFVLILVLIQYSR